MSILFTFLQKQLLSYFIITLFSLKNLPIIKMHKKRAEISLWSIIYNSFTEY